MAGKLIADTLQNGTGSTFDLATNIAQLARVKTYQVTDSTDVSLSATPANVGSTFSATIPTKGFIWIMPESFRILNGTSSTGYFGFFIKIGSTVYQPTGSDNGTAKAGWNYNGRNNTNAQYWQQNSPTANITYWNPGFSPAGGGTVLAIQGEAIPTGAQTIQVVCGTATSTSDTLKGTAVTTRVNVAIFDHS